MIERHIRALAWWFLPNTLPLFRFRQRIADLLFKMADAMSDKENVSGGGQG